MSPRGGLILTFKQCRKIIRRSNPSPLLRDAMNGPIEELEQFLGKKVYRNW